MWSRRFPERETVILAGFILYTAQQMPPRSKKHKLAKPMSVYQRHLALRRHFDDVELPPFKAVQDAVKGMIRRFIRKFGIEQLRPHKAEPMTTRIVEQIVRGARSAPTGHSSSLVDWEFFIVTAWEVVNLYFGSRKGESTRLAGDVDHNDWLTRACLSWRIWGIVVLNPTQAQLLGLARGDVARLAPKGAKCAQCGTCLGTEPQ